ncbi:zinc finger protein 536-like [Sitophilus oryzae]|uniref:Zinc finger protein 536-like n=1 Tax=Sitophilus oryzae TaxID=7048 RepID=A0A6J2YR74_SITOR|nr:zinc finger protein 536-like [Sitophilus oryzae]
MTEKAAIIDHYLEFYYFKLLSYGTRAELEDYSEPVMDIDEILSIKNVLKPKSDNFDSTDNDEILPFVCPKCGRSYKWKSSLRNHVNMECGKEPQFECPYCEYKAKQKGHVIRHIGRLHNEMLSEIDYNGWKKQKMGKSVGGRVVKGHNMKR